jgi:hypothetical protein
MSKFTEAQEKVFQAAKAEMENEWWFKEVCCDDFPSDQACQDNFENSVNAVTCATAMWDNPDVFCLC